MDENQKKQLEIIREAISSNPKALKELECAKQDLHQAVKALVDGLDIYNVIMGHSDAVLAATALVGLSQQIDQLL